jgi:hypothetical protein
MSINCARPGPSPNMTKQKNCVWLKTKSVCSISSETVVRYGVKGHEPFRKRHLPSSSLSTARKKLSSELCQFELCFINFFLVTVLSERARKREPISK